MRKLLLTLTGMTLLILMSMPSAHALDRSNRLGVGLSNQLIGDLPSIALKLQKSKAIAVSALMGMSSRDPGGGYAGAVKIYRIIFDEPQLNFYGSALGGLVKNKLASEDQSGFQIDLTLGTEFSFTGLESIGFSFEFGLSINKLDEMVIETVGNNFLVAGMFFYL